MLLCVLLAACGGSEAPSAGPTPLPPPPMVPAPPVAVAHIAGQWAGRFTMRLDAREYVLQAHTTLAQDDHAVTGTWWVTTDGWDWRGEFAGTLSGIGVETTFAGTVTLNTTSSDPSTRCHARGAVNGSAGGQSLRWTAPQLTADVCEGVLTSFDWLWAPVINIPSPPVD